MVRVFWALALCSSVAAQGVASDEAVNKVDAGFFLLLNKLEQENPRLAAINKVDSGFFLILDKKETAPASAVELGRQLFFDPRLSGNRAMSCASCHNPSLGWADGLARARGLSHQELKRNTPSLLNVPFTQQRFFLDGRADTVEEASLTALQSRSEMNRDLKELIVELNRIADYPRQFVEVYGLSAMTPANLGKALASFIRAEIRSGETAFDRSSSDPAALTPAEGRGLVTFTGKGACVKCHVGPGFSDAFFHNTGLRPLAGVEDAGRFAIDSNQASWRAFSTPSLRNVGHTAPYMHDGSLLTLREVVEFYDRGGDEARARDPLIKPLGLTPAEKEDLVAFLKALTPPLRPAALPVLPVEQGPGSVAQALDWNRQRLLMLDRDLKDQDRLTLHANARAIWENSREIARLGPASPCLEEVGTSAMDLSQTSETAAWKDLKTQVRKLGALSDSCAELVSRGAAPEAWRPKICDGSFSVEGLLKEARTSGADGRLASVQDDVIEYFQNRAFAAQDPEVCAGAAQVKKSYFGITRTGEWGCREWFYDLATARALMTRSPEIETWCRRSHAHDYPGMPKEDGAKICAVIAKNIDRPEELCSKLIPAYMGTENHKACVNEFSLYVRRDDIGRTQEGIPPGIFNRYVGLDSFTIAKKAGDPALCGESETCRVLMGQGSALARETAKRVQNRVCVVRKPGLPADVRASVPQGAR